MATQPSFIQKQGKITLKKDKVISAPGNFYLKWGDYSNLDKSYFKERQHFISKWGNMLIQSEALFSKWDIFLKLA